MNLAVLQRVNGGGQPMVTIEPLKVRLRLIGQMEAWTLEHENIVPSGRKTRALLAVLALSAPRPMLRGKLAELLWSRRPEEQARASLRQEIHRLLDVLNPAGANILDIHRDHMMLRPGSVWIDVEEIARATPARPAALSLLDGELLEDLDGIDAAFDLWLAAERERLRDRGRHLAEAILREQTEPDSAIAAAQQLLAIDRSHEGAWRALMNAYAQRGERGMALQAYERCRVALSEQLDALPSDETQALFVDLRKSLQRGATGGQTATKPAPEIRNENRADSRADRSGESRGEARPQAGRAAEMAEVKLRLGVLPFQLAGAAVEEAHLGIAIAEEIAAALAHFGKLTLVSSAAFGRVGGAREEAAARRALAVDYLLEGTVQRAAERLRVSLRLSDMRAGNRVVWTRRFDASDANLLVLQDEIAGQAAAQVDAEIEYAESQIATLRDIAEPDARTLIARALPGMLRLERTAFARSGEMLRAASVQEPSSAAAHALFARWLVLSIEQGWAGDADAAATDAVAAGEQALALDPSDAAALTAAGQVRASVQLRPAEALSLYERALRLNPNLALAWNLSGIAQACLGAFDEAERRLRHAKALLGSGPHSLPLDAGSVLLALLRRDHATAFALGRESIDVNPSHAAACVWTLAALGHLGRRGDAEVVLRRLLAIDSRFSVAGWMARCPITGAGDRAHVEEGLLAAGVR